jgi:hypothetical protein
VKKVARLRLESSEVSRIIQMPYLSSGWPMILVVRIIGRICEIHHPGSSIFQAASYATVIGEIVEKFV